MRCASKASVFEAHTGEHKTNSSIDVCCHIWHHRDAMSNKLDFFLEASRNRLVSVDEQEEQRRSFAFGNTHFENEHITRETIDMEAEALKNDTTNRYPAR